MKMHWCSCRINLSGQGFTIIDIHQYDPVSWPEVMVLQQMHGMENVAEIKPVGVGDSSPTDEKRRLLGKYGRITEVVFPGRVFRMEMLMPGEADDQSPRDENGRMLAGLEPPKPEKPKPEPPPDDEDDDVAAQPPPAPAVFRPGKHQPPRKEA